MSLTSRWWVHTVTDDMGNAGHALYYGSHRVDLEERDVLEHIARAMNNQEEPTPSRHPKRIWQDARERLEDDIAGRRE